MNLTVGKKYNVSSADFNGKKVTMPGVRVVMVSWDREHGLMVTFVNSSNKEFQIPLKCLGTVEEVKE